MPTTWDRTASRYGWCKASSVRAEFLCASRLCLYTVFFETMPRTVSSVVHVKLAAHEAWRARSSLELEQQIAALNKRKLTLLEREVLHAGAADEQERRLVRCDLSRPIFWVGRSWA